MTREEALKVLEMFLHKQCDLARTEFAYDANTVWEAVNMASKALERKSSDDAISRQEVLNTCLNLYFNGYKEKDLIYDIKNLQSVKPQEKTGHWKRVSMDKYTESAKYWYKCDKCGEINLGNTNFCPNCGAKMESEGMI